MNSNEYHRLMSEAHFSRCLIFVLLATVLRYHDADALLQGAAIVLSGIHLIKSILEELGVKEDG